MSEQVSNFDPLEQARKDAQLNDAGQTERQRYGQWVGEGQVDPQAASDMADFLQTEPNLRVDGGVHHPKNHQRINDTDAYFHKKRDAHYSASLKENAKLTDYESMGVAELAKKLGEAEAYDDRTAQLDINDVLLGKMIGFSDSKLGTTSKSAEFKKDAETNFIDRVLRIKDARKAELLEGKTFESSESGVMTVDENLTQQEYDAFPHDAEVKTSGNLEFDEDPLFGSIDGVVLDSKTPIFDEALAAVDDASEVKDKVVSSDDNDSEAVADEASAEDEALDGAVKSHRKQSKTIFAAAKAKLGELRQKVSNGHTKVGGAVIAVTSSITTKEYWNNEKDGRRHKIIAGVIGVVALGTVAVLIAKGIHHDGHGGGNNNVAPKNPDITKDHSEHHKAVYEKLGRKGDTISDHALRDLHKQGIEHPTSEQITKKTEKILKLNHLSWKKARSLPVGFKFRTK